MLAKFLAQWWSAMLHNVFKSTCKYLKESKGGCLLWPLITFASQFRV